MAIAFDTSASTTGQFPGTTTIVVNITSGAISDGCFVLGIGSEDASTSATVSSVVSVPALTWILVDNATATAGGNDQIAHLYYAVGVAASTGYVVTVTFGATVDYFPGAYVASFSGVDQSTPQDAEGENSSVDTSITSLSATLTTVTAGAMLVDCFVWGGGGDGNPSAGSGQTGFVGTVDFFGGYELMGGAAAQTDTVNFTSASSNDRYAMVVVALKPSSGAAAVTPQRMMLMGVS